MTEAAVQFPRRAKEFQVLGAAVSFTGYQGLVSQR